MPTARQTEPASSPLPGLAVVGGIAAGAWLLVTVVGHLPDPLGRLPVSMMLVAILAGLALSGLAAQRPGWHAGLDLAHGPLLKLAVALIGLRLSLTELGQLGLGALPLVLAVVMLGLLLALGLARLLGVGGRLAALLAVGTAICGASAIAAAAPGLKARSEEVSYAIACIALIGLAATLCYPMLLQGVLKDPQAIGMAMGVAIHDTAQVTAAAVFHQQAWQAEGTLVAATVAKLIRNAGMLLLIPAVVWLANRRSREAGARVALPMFIIAFVLLSGLRSLGDAVLGAEHDRWLTAIDLAGQVSLFAFAMAMAALAMAVRPAELRQIGWTPALVAVTTAAAMLLMAILWLR